MFGKVFAHFQANFLPIFDTKHCWNLVILLIILNKFMNLYIETKLILYNKPIKPKM